MMWKNFFPNNPYEAFDPSPFPEDLQGWGADDPVFEAIINFVKPRLIVEVGSWKGRSAVNMAKLCAAAGVSTQIICVDTWLGSTEVYTRRETEPESYQAMRFKNGWPQLYYQFLANVVRHGLQEVITPLPQTSATAARLLAHFQIVPDLVYVDASHEYNDVGPDIMSFLRLLRPGVVLFGDDYAYWEGVTEAVHKVAERIQHPFWGRPGKYAFIKNGDARLIPNIE